MKQNSRIFWLGMHVVLTKTELPRLRALGYEVFNPPYNSSIYDQSANLDWDKNQKTTLPRHVFETLRQFNFFYNEIPSYIGEILNEFFDVIVVTINPDWLASIIKVYTGKIIYRTYGQPYPLGPELIRRGLWRHIISRENFYFVPFCEESLENEHDWLRERAIIVPYHLTDDVFPQKDTWSTSRHENIVTVNIPNIANPYYRSTFDNFNQKYPEDHFTILGVQPPGASFRRAVGTLPRETQFEFYKKSKAHFYPYSDLVCYLPPIESMVIGVPVIYNTGSLLHRLFGAFSPGLAINSEHAKAKISLLLADDEVFIKEVIESQEKIRLRYSPEFVQPIFDSVFNGIISSDSSQNTYTFEDSMLSVRADARGKEAGLSEDGVKTIWVLNHFGGTISYNGNKASCYEGIPRVIDQFITGILLASSHRIVITIARGCYEAARDFFSAALETGRVSLYLVGDRFDGLQAGAEGDGENGNVTGGQQVSWCAEVAAQYHGSPSLVLHAAEEVGQRMVLAQKINSDDSTLSVIVPHYYYFPEASFIEKDIVMYVPDFFPHLFPGTQFDGGNDKRNAAIGRHIASKASSVITMSAFTAKYLPESALQIHPGKIRVIPVPWLSNGRYQPLERGMRQTLEKRLGGWPYIFYPTANRPNKQLPFLMEVFARLRTHHPDLLLVLTTAVNDDAPLGKLALDLGVRDAVITVENATDDALIWLYEQTSALCLSSTAEGNFPPQIIEALIARAPVVSTKLPTIAELLGDYSESLSLCLPMNAGDFVNNLNFALSHRAEVVSRQEPLREAVLRWCSPLNIGRAVVAAVEGRDMPEDGAAAFRSLSPIVEPRRRFS